MLVAMHAFFSSFRKERCCGLKQEPVKAGIGKWFCTRENEKRWQITDRNISLRKIILAKKQLNTLMENQQTWLKTNGLMTPNQNIRMSKELLMQNHMRTYC
jgi:hypothetical protein